MKVHEFSHVAMVVGSGKVWYDVIVTLLNNNTCVFVPVNNLKEIESFQNSHTTKGKLVVELIDIADYKRAETFVNEFVAKYGKIDMSICVFKDMHRLARKYFFNISSIEFEKVINKYVINFFIFFRIALNSMRKDNHGMFINIQDRRIEEVRAESSMSSFIEKIQIEVNAHFLKELQKHKVKYHHLSVDSLQTATKNLNESITNFIMNLCKSSIV